jgi:hypothetical protein
MELMAAMIAANSRDRRAILVLQDTTEFTFQRERSEGIGITYRVNSGKDKAGRFRMHTVCGLLMHSSLAVTLDGLPPGLSAIKFWTRTKFKGTAALKKKINPTGSVANFSLTPACHRSPAFCRRVVHVQGAAISTDR